MDCQPLSGFVHRDAETLSSVAEPNWISFASGSSCPIREE